MARQRKRKDFNWLGGGLVTLPRDDQKELLEKGRLYCPDISDLDLFRPGSARLFTKFTPRGTTMLATTPKYSQPLSDLFFNINNFETYTAFGLGMIWTSNDTRAVQSAQFTMRWSDGFTAQLQASIYTVSGGFLPQTLVATSQRQWFTAEPAATGQVVTFTFQTIPALSAATDYYIVVEGTLGAMPVGSYFGMAYDTNQVAIVAERLDAINWAQFGSSPFKVLLQAGDPPVTGLYDARFASPAPIQYYMGSNGGYLVAGNPTTVDGGGGWGNPIWTGGNTSRFQLWDFVQFNNLVFIADYGAHAPRCWDGIRGPDRSPVQTDANSTMQAGYKSPLTVGRSGAGAGTWDATGVVQVLIVTTLISGGYRATYGFVTITTVADDVNLTAIAVDAVPSQFYFDIGTNATQVFCTAPGRGIFYKVPVASLSTAANPFPNNTTSVTISGMADAVLEAEPDLETLLGFPTGYFTQQIAVPDAKFMQTYANSLFMAGDGTASVWISALDAPNVWGEAGRVYGVRLDIEPADGEPITGLKVADRAIFVAKPHYLYRIDFTGDANLPWRVTQVHGRYGTYSHWSMKVIPSGLLFLDDSGPAICFGTYSALAPGTENILNLFSGRVANELTVPWYPLSQTALPYASAALETDFNRVTWTLATGQSADATKAVLLIYDYVQKQFSVRLQPASVLAVIGDANGFERIWKGDYAGQAYALSDDHYDTTGPAPEIETPWLDLGEPSVYKDGEYLYLWGQKMASAPPYTSWAVVVYVDGADPLDRSYLTNPYAQVIYFDASNPQFVSGGLAFRLAPRAWRKIKLRILAPKGVDAPAALDGFAIEWTPEGERR
jgi:hypothetical protein